MSATKGGFKVRKIIFLHTEMDTLGLKMTKKTCIDEFKAKLKDDFKAILSGFKAILSDFKVILSDFKAILIYLNLILRPFLEILRPF